MDSRPNSEVNSPARLWLPALRKLPSGRQTDTVDNMATQKWMSWLKDRHYDKAPIKEAIIDIQIENSPSLTLANFEKVKISPPRGYAQRQKVMMGQLRGQLEGGYSQRRPSRTRSAMRSLEAKGSMSYSSG